MGYVIQLFYRLAVPVCYSHVSVSHSPSDPQRFTSIHSRVPKFVRSAVLVDRYFNGSDEAEPLVKFVEAATNLRYVFIKGSYKVSQKLLDAINTSVPLCEVEVQAYFPRAYYRSPPGWEKPGRLAGGMDGFSSLQLRTLWVSNEWPTNDLENLVVTQSLRKIIKNCPNLRSFKADRAMSDYTWGGNTRRDIALDLNASDQLPHLEEYWYFPLSVDTLRAWGAFTGWDTLRVLKLSSPDYLPAFAGRIPTLRHFTIAMTRATDFDSLDAFYGLDAPLQEIHMQKLKEPFIPHNFLSQYEETVRQVSLCPISKRAATFYPEDLRKLATSCPKLERLLITIPSNAKVPDGYVEELSSFDHLAELILNCIVPDTPPTIEDFHLMCDAFRDLMTRSTLQVLAFQGVWHNGPRNMAFKAQFLCESTPSGDFRITESDLGKNAGNDDNVHQRNKQQASQLLLSKRAFMRKFPQTSLPNDAIWVAKRIDSAWAEKELVSDGLLTRADLESVKEPPSWLVRWFSEMSEEERHRLKTMVKKELLYWKGVRESYERYGNRFFLYDVMYPIEGEGQRLGTPGGMV